MIGANPPKATVANEYGSFTFAAIPVVGVVALGGPVISALSGEVATAFGDTPLVAVATTRINFPSSAETVLYVAAVAPLIAAQVVKSVSEEHLCH